MEAFSSEREARERSGELYSMGRWQSVQSGRTPAHFLPCMANEASAGAPGSGSEAKGVGGVLGGGLKMASGREGW